MIQAVAGTTPQSGLAPAFDIELQSPLWDGSWCRLEQNRSVNMPQTSDSAMTFVAFTFTKDIGSVRLASGVNTPKTLEVDGRLKAPIPFLHNGRGDNLEVTNTSATDIPIWIAAVRFGSGNPVPLRNDGTPVVLSPSTSARGRTQHSLQDLNLWSPDPYAVFTVMYGGDAFIYALNAPGELPEGYTDIRHGHTMLIPRNFRGAEVCVANLSPYQSGEGAVWLD